MSSVSAVTLLKIADDLKEVNITNFNLSKLIVSIKKVLDKIDFIAGLDFRSPSNRLCFAALMESIVNWMNELNILSRVTSLIEDDINGIVELTRIVGQGNRVKAIKPFTRLLRNLLDVFGSKLNETDMEIINAREKIIELTYIVGDKATEVDGIEEQYEKCSRVQRMIKRTFGGL